MNAEATSLVRVYYGLNHRAKYVWIYLRPIKVSATFYEDISGFPFEYGYFEFFLKKASIYIREFIEVVWYLSSFPFRLIEYFEESF